MLLSKEGAFVKLKIECEDSALSVFHASKAPSGIVYAEIVS